MKTASDRGRVLLGPITGICEPAFIETCAHFGCDLYVLDLEHGNVSDPAIEAAARTAEAAGVPILARVTLEAMERAIRFLDSGGAGLIVAHVSSLSDVDRIVEAALFPPSGRRGVGPSRLSKYGAQPTTREWLDAANDGVFLGIQLEDRAAIESCDRLAGRPEVHGVLIGTRDLSIDLGIPGQYDHPLIINAKEQVNRTCRRTGKTIITVARSKPVAPEESDVILFSPGLVLQQGIEQLRNRGKALAKALD